MLRKYFILILILFSINFASSLGCCVSSNQESCSTNSEQSSCEEYGGSFFNGDLSCSTQRVCDSGCCILGLDSARMIRGKCQSETRNNGFSAINFLQTTEDCSKYIVSQEWGACIGLDSYGKKTCKFATRTQCIGEFFSDVLCSSVEKSNCNKTSNRVCFGNNVFLVDSCGNRDELVNECNYGAGQICKQTSNESGTMASCDDASCLDSFDYTRFILKDLYKTVPIFSPIKRNQGDVWCVTNGNVPFSDEELGRDFNEFGNPISGVAGLKFFSRYCVDGQIITEACGDGKDGYCSGQSDLGSGQISVGTGGKCAGNEWRTCLSAESETDCDTTYCFWFSPEIKGDMDKDILDTLEISKCLPKISGGILDSASSSSVCSAGDFSSDLDTKGVSLITSPFNKFVLLNPETMAILDYRCSRIADCTGKINWVGEYGRNSSNGIEYLNRTEIIDALKSKNILSVILAIYGPDFVALLNSYLDDRNSPLDIIKNYELANYPKDKFPVAWGKSADDTLEYRCVPRKASINGDCSKCNLPGSICSQYSCEAIGSNCEFMSSGTCERKTDLSPPAITVNCPSSSSIGVQQSVNIGVNTSESSYCRFSLESAMASYDVMPYDFGTTWGSSHNIILSVPGSNNVNVGNSTQYPLLLKSGIYNLFIRCIDPRGNGDTSPAKLCSFEVPKTPDKNPPVILKFTPLANTPIVFNTTSKKIDMLVNEPVDCKWSLVDQAYNLMPNGFNCSRNLLFSNTVSGYNCQTILKNITKNIGNSTKFYIRCKDQPDLEGNESITYTRNVNDKSTTYILRPSEKLEIVEISPKSRVVLGPNFADWNLTVRTAGGGYQGMTDCKWKLDYKNFSTAFSSFSATQSTFKSQSINQKTEGDYTLSVACSDNSGNIVNYSGALEIKYDRISPAISRVYNDKGSLKVTTSEPAICKFTNVFSVGVGCAFTISHPNLTTMLDSSTTEHTANWKKGASYFVKCQDFYGNENSICGLIAKAV